MPKIDVLKADVVKWSAFYEHRIRMGSVCLPFLATITLFHVDENWLMLDIEGRLPP